jgi:hypothetical protein
LAEVERHVAQKRAMNVKMLEEARTREVGARRERERRIMEEAQILRNHHRESVKMAQEVCPLTTALFSPLRCFSCVEEEWLAGVARRALRSVEVSG